MNNKDYIEIQDAEGNVSTMELVFEFEYQTVNYIIYKELNKNILYAAKYYNDIEQDFCSNMTKEELEMCQKVFEELQNGNYNNNK